MVAAEQREKAALRQQLHGEKQRYLGRVAMLKSDLQALYRATEDTAQENSRVKKEAKRRALQLHTENDRLRQSIKQSHSNLRVKQTEAESPGLCI